MSYFKCHVVLIRLNVTTKMDNAKDVDSRYIWSNCPEGLDVPTPNRGRMLHPGQFDAKIAYSPQTAVLAQLSRLATLAYRQPAAPPGHRTALQYKSSPRATSGQTTTITGATAQQVRTCPNTSRNVARAEKLWAGSRFNWEYVIRNTHGSVSVKLATPPRRSAAPSSFLSATVLW